MFIVRGEHESASMSQVRGEVRRITGGGDSAWVLVFLTRTSYLISRLMADGSMPLGCGGKSSSLNSCCRKFSVERELLEFDGMMLENCM